jgi:hypothetical protein
MRGNAHYGLRVWMRRDVSIDLPRVAMQSFIIDNTKGDLRHGKFIAKIFSDDLIPLRVMVKETRR